VATVFVGTRKQKKPYFFPKKKRGREKTKEEGEGGVRNLGRLNADTKFRAFIPGVPFHQVPHLGAQ
jgi:hypothetical protein